MNIQYKFDLNLRQIAAVRIAALLWEKQMTNRKERRLLLCHLSTQSWVNSFEYGVNMVIEPPCIQGLCPSLPAAITNDLNAIIRSLGTKIYHWYAHFTALYQFDLSKTIKCNGRIWWTSNGIIDYKRTFELYWLTNTELSKHDIFAMACECWLEDHIRAHWEPTSDDFPAFPRTSLALYWQSQLAGDLEQLEIKLNTSTFMLTEFQFLYENRHIFQCDPSGHVLLPIFILMLAIHRGNVDALKYVWETLNEPLRKRFIIPITIYLMDRCYSIPTEGYAHVSAFIFTHLTTGDILMLHQRGREFLQSILSYFMLWPWHDYIIPTLKKVWACFVEADFDELLQVADLMDSIKGLMELYKWETKRQMLFLYRIWRTIPKRLKLASFPQSYKKMVRGLLKNGCSQNVKIIINDEDIASIRDNLMVDICKTFKNRDGKLDCAQLDPFLDLVCTSEMEKELVKIKIALGDCVSSQKSA